MIRTVATYDVPCLCVPSGSVTYEAVPEEERKGLPRYPVPMVLLARLAVDFMQREGLGEMLLVDTLKRSLGL